MAIQLNRSLCNVHIPSHCIILLTGTGPIRQISVVPHHIQCHPWSLSVDRLGSERRSSLVRSPKGLWFQLNKRLSLTLLILPVSKVDQVKRISPLSIDIKLSPL